MHTLRISYPKVFARIAFGIILLFCFATQNHAQSHKPWGIAYIGTLTGEKGMPLVDHPISVSLTFRHGNLDYTYTYTDTTTTDSEGFFRILPEEQPILFAATAYVNHKLEIKVVNLDPGRKLRDTLIVANYSLAKITEGEDAWFYMSGDNQGTLDVWCDYPVCCYRDNNVRNHLYGYVLISFNIEESESAKIYAFAKQNFSINHPNAKSEAKKKPKKSKVFSRGMTYSTGAGNSSKGGFATGGYKDLK